MLLLNLLKVVDGVRNDIGQMVFYLFHLVFYALYHLVCLETVVLRYAFDFDFGQLDNVVAVNLAPQEFLERYQLVVDGIQHRFPGLALLNANVKSVLNEYFFQR